MIKIYRYLLPVVSLFLISYFSFNYNTETSQLKLPGITNPDTFVLLELFTSQSCSSCPAANDHLANLLKVIKEKDLPVYPIVFHVDYWNHLGWVDSFSDEKYTERQYMYARVFSKLNVYTPQMIINGREEFIGFDVEECNRIIESELSSGEVIPVSLEAGYRLVDASMEVQYNVDSKFTGVINFALIQKECTVSITGGENKGREMNYLNIVRQFSQINCREKPSGKITFRKPENVSDDNLKVIVYLQNKIDMQIVNVTEATLL